MRMANKAQQHAIKTLVNKNREEYLTLYRDEVIRLGGKPQRTKEQIIADLKKRINEKEGRGV